MAALALAFAWSAQAQTNQSPDVPATSSATTSDTLNAQATPLSTTGQRPMHDRSSGSYSVIPYATHGYIGVNVGKPDWDAPCAAGFACSESDVSYNLYTGGMFNPYLGAELGYVDFGRFDRAGGRTRAHGLNLSLVGQVPFGGLTLYAKVGTLYGRTKVSASPLSGLATGKDSGWEASYGVGAGFNFSPQSTVVLEWNRYELNFVDVGRRDITTTSLGYVYRF